MKRFLAVFFAAVAALFAVPAAAGAQTAPAATIMLLHGIPGTPVLVDGKVVIPNFEPGKMQDLTSFAGKTLTNLEVRLAGKTDVAIGPVAKFDVPATGNYTVVAHLDAAGKPTLTPFKNDTSALEAGKGRLTVRHTAAAPAVDIVLGSARPFTNLANGKEGSAALAAGSIAGAKVAPTGKDPIADVPTVDLKAGTNLIVYAVGSLEAKTFTFAPVKVRDLARQRLRFLPRLLRAGGHTGWVVLFDEVELIGRYSLLQRGRSYAELARWLDGDPQDEGEPLITVAAITDDFEAAVLLGKHDLEGLPQRLRDKQTEEYAEVAALAEVGMRHIVDRKSVV